MPVIPAVVPGPLPGSIGSSPFQASSPFLSPATPPFAFVPHPTIQHSAIYRPGSDAGAVPNAVLALAYVLGLLDPKTACAPEAMFAQVRRAEEALSLVAAAEGAAADGTIPAARVLALRAQARAALERTLFCGGDERRDAAREDTLDQLYEWLARAGGKPLLVVPSVPGLVPVVDDRTRALPSNLIIVSASNGEEEPRPASTAGSSAAAFGRRSAGPAPESAPPEGMAALAFGQPLLTRFTLPYRDPDLASAEELMAMRRQLAAMPESDLLALRAELERAAGYFTIQGAPSDETYRRFRRYEPEELEALLQRMGVPAQLDRILVEMEISPTQRARYDDIARATLQRRLFSRQENYWAVQGRQVTHLRNALAAFIPAAECAETGPADSVFINEVVRLPYAEWITRREIGWFRHLGLQWNPEDLAWEGDRFDALLAEVKEVRALIDRRLTEAKWPAGRFRPELRDWIDGLSLPSLHAVRARADDILLLQQRRRTGPELLSALPMPTPREEGRGVVATTEGAAQPPVSTDWDAMDPHYADINYGGRSWRDIWRMDRILFPWLRDEGTARFYANIVSGALQLSGGQLIMLDAGAGPSWIGAQLLHAMMEKCRTWGVPIESERLILGEYSRNNRQYLRAMREGRLQHPIFLKFVEFTGGESVLDDQGYVVPFLADDPRRLAHAERVMATLMEKSEIEFLDLHAPPDDLKGKVAVSTALTVTESLESSHFKFYRLALNWIDTLAEYGVGMGTFMERSKVWSDGKHVYPAADMPREALTYFFRLVDLLAKLHFIERDPNDGHSDYGGIFGAVFTKRPGYDRSVVEEEIVAYELGRLFDQTLDAMPDRQAVLDRPLAPPLDLSELPLDDLVANDAVRLDQLTEAVAAAQWPSHIPRETNPHVMREMEDFTGMYVDHQLRTPEEWSRLVPEIDADGNVRIGGHPVMEGWERRYMKQLAWIATRNGGAVLEGGFGMAISASYIQELGRSSGVTAHVIVEANAVMAQKAREFAEQEATRGGIPVFVIEGYFPDVLYEQDHPDVQRLLQATGWTDLRNRFSGAMVDTYPLSEKLATFRRHEPEFRPTDSIMNQARYVPFLREFVVPGGVFTYFSDEVNGYRPKHLARLMRAGVRLEQMTGVPIPVEPPVGDESCEYWEHPFILAPIIVNDGPEDVVAFITRSGLNQEPPAIPSLDDAEGAGPR